MSQTLKFLLMILSSIFPFVAYSSSVEPKIKGYVDVQNGFEKVSRSNNDETKNISSGEVSAKRDLSVNDGSRIIFSNSGTALAIAGGAFTISNAVMSRR